MGLKDCSSGQQDCKLHLLSAFAIITSIADSLLAISRKNSVSMSDVYKLQDYSCNNSTSGALLSTEQIFIIATISTTFTLLVALLLLTFCSAMKIAKHLPSSLHEIEININPDVIIVEESKDLQSQTSTQQLTLNSKDILDDYYEKRPSTENSEHHPSTPMPRNERSSRQLFPFPSIREDINETNDFSNRESCGSLGQNIFRAYHSNQRNSNTSVGTYGSIGAYGTIPRKTVLRKMDSQEQVNQLTRFLFLNEDVELVRDNNVNTRRVSMDVTGNRKLSMDFLNNLMPESGTLKKSMTNLAHSPMISAAIQRKKKKSLTGIPQSPSSPCKSPDEESISSVASEATLKAEPIKRVEPVKNKVPTKYVKNQKINTYDTLTYRRQRRVGVHFSQSINQPETDV